MPPLTMDRRRNDACAVLQTHDEKSEGGMTLRPMIVLKRAEKQRLVVELFRVGLGMTCNVQRQKA